MDWNNNMNPRPFIPRPAAQSSFAFLYNYNNDHYVYPPGAMALPDIINSMNRGDEASNVAPLAMMEMSQNEYENNNQDKKKRLTSEQLALENTFQEEKKLDPDTKMKLAHDLSLQPRQISVWFQNQRARWKTKQLEGLYATLKQEFDAVSREKQKLQEEVLALRTILKEEVSKKQGAGSSTGYIYMSGEEAVESTSAATNQHHHQLTLGQHQPVAATTTAMVTIDSNYMMNFDAGSSVPTPSYSNWPVLPSYP